MITSVVIIIDLFKYIKENNFSLEYDIYILYIYIYIYIYITTMALRRHAGFEHVEHSVSHEPISVLVNNIFMLLA